MWADTQAPTASASGRGSQGEKRIAGRLVLMSVATTVWRGYIAFGLISIPVRLFRAARTERVKLREVHRVPPLQRAETGGRRERLAEPEPEASPQRIALRGNLPPKEPLEFKNPLQVPSLKPRTAEPEEIFEPVKRAATSQTDGTILTPNTVTKGYEYAENEYVALEREELKSIAPKTSTEMEILEFVALGEIDPIYFEASYYVRPDAPGEKPYALLHASMQETGLVALARFAMHRREHVVVIRPGKKGMIAHTMYFGTEVRAEEEYRTDPQLVDRKEVQLANTLVRSLAGKFDAAKYRDSYREQLEAMIAAKVQGWDARLVEPRPHRAPVDDISEALRKSLALIKKRAASTGQNGADERTRKQASGERRGKQRRQR
jgi:DNA end-binding protein Ku